MKTFLIAFILLLICWSCVQEESNTPDPEICGTEVALSFVMEKSADTKAFGQNTATTAEKAVLSAKLFIFKTGNKVFEKYLTSSELTSVGSQPITFNVPGLTASTSYDYYMIINAGDVSAANLTALQALTQTDIASYNGAWSAVNDNSATPKRTGGFVMTGNTTQPTTPDLTQTQTVTIAMKRISAKMDINIIIDNTVFGSGNKYGGTMVIDSAIISKTQASSSLIPGTPPTTAGTLTLPKQNSNAATANLNYQNRFYLFENGTLAAGSRVVLSLYGTYTNNSTSSLVVYTTELNGTGDGSIVRNGSYSVTANIKGLTGSSLSVSITLSDWETIVTQTANLGS